VKPSHAQNASLINHTRRVWQRRLGRNLGREDARQIIDDVTGFFNVLSEWAEASTPANDDGVRGAVHYDRPRVQRRHAKSALPCAFLPLGKEVGHERV
jgi:hypothetical protein